MDVMQRQLEENVTLCESKYWVPDSAAQVRPKVINTNIGIYNNTNAVAPDLARISTGLSMKLM